MFSNAKSFWALGIALIGLSGCDSTTSVAGRMNLPSGENVRISNDKGESMTLSEGIMSADIITTGIMGRTIISLKKDGEVLNFSVPKAAFVSPHEITMRVTSDHGTLILHGFKESEVLNRRQYETTRSCSYPGYCTTCGTIVDSNGMRTQCGFGFFMNCPGSQHVLELATSYRDDYTFDFYDALNNNKVFAHFQSSGNLRTETSPLHALSSCY